MSSYDSTNDNIKTGDNDALYNAYHIRAGQISSLKDDSLKPISYLEKFTTEDIANGCYHIHEHRDTK